VRRLSHASSLGRIGDCPPGLLGRLLCIREIQDALSFATKYFSVLVSILRNHEAADGWYLEGAHHMAIPVGPSHEAKINRSIGRQSADRIVWQRRAAIRIQSAVTLPIATDQNGPKPRVAKSLEEDRSIGICSSYKKDTVTAFGQSLTRRTEQVFIIPEWKVSNIATANSVQILLICPARGENHTVFGEYRQLPTCAMRRVEWIVCGEIQTPDSESPEGYQSLCADRCLTERQQCARLGLREYVDDMPRKPFQAHGSPATETPQRNTQWGGTGIGRADVDNLAGQSDFASRSQQASGNVRVASRPNQNDVKLRHGGWSSPRLSLRRFARRPSE
jgi:hypothetical protein